MNLIEKIASKYSPDRVIQGAFIAIKPHCVMTHDNTYPVITKFAKINATSIFNPAQICVTLDHDVQNKSEENLKKYSEIRKFARKHAIDFYPAGFGIGHQIMVEQGYAFPQTLSVASDSHSNHYGGIGCLGTPIVRTDAAAIWATGQTWWQVPSVVKVEFYGDLNPGVTGKDIIITLCSLFNKDNVLNCAIEFSGPSIIQIPIDDRLTIANMTTEWGALAGVFPVDARTLSWVSDRSNKLNKGAKHPRYNSESIRSLSDNILKPDSNATYAKLITLDLSSVEPNVSGPNSVKIATSARELEKKCIKVDKAYLISCTNSRESDLKAAADQINGRKIMSGVEFYIAAASKEVQKESEINGDWQKLLDAGAIPLPSGCGPCIGLGIGLLREGEVGISASNRNYKGRMGSPLAQAYLASPAVVAESAVSGYIKSTLTISSAGPIGTFEERKAIPVKSEVTQEAGICGFPSTLNGELVFCDSDNLNTDGIYPGKYTYQDSLTAPEMAKVAMQNYDAKFAEMVMKNDILVSGFNFGTGSSREQAATCLLYSGIKLVIAGSFSQTFKRNAVNNGLLVLESPELIKMLRETFKSTLTCRTGIMAKVNLIEGTIKTKSGDFIIPKVGRAAQEIVVAGGLESWIKTRIEKNKPV